MWCGCAQHSPAECLILGAVDGRPRNAQEVDLFEMLVDLLAAGEVELNPLRVKVAARGAEFDRS